MPLLLRTSVGLALSTAALFAFSQTACTIKSTSASYDFFARYKHVGKIQQDIRISYKRFSIDTSKETGFFLSKRHTEEQSQGVFDAGGIQPVNYQSRNKSMDQKWRFLPGKHRIQGTMNTYFIRLSQKKWPIYDRTSYLLALRCALLKGGMTQKNFRVFEQGRIINYQARLVTKNKRINTKLGSLNTTEVRVLTTPDIAIFLLWFANDDNYLLVQSSTLAGAKGSSFSSISHFNYL